MPKLTDNNLFIIGILGLLTGTLDAIAVVIIDYPATNPEQAFRYIAGGLFIERASPGDHMVLWGIFFHYLIALLFCAAFFTMQPKFKGFVKNIYLLGIAYGIFAWIVMNLAVLPLTNVSKPPESLHIVWPPIIKGIIALIICLGLPVALISERYYAKQSRRRARRHRSGTSHR